MHIVLVAMVFVPVWYVDGCKKTVSYSCVKLTQKEEVTVDWCWDITKLFRCKQSSFKPVYESQTCVREDCCTGYQGSYCEPVCFDEHTCPNGGKCRAPNVCACAPGFYGDRCDDIDECRDRNGGCSHECTNTPGSYACSCPDGFTMATNMHTCIEIRTTTPSRPGACAINNGNCSHNCVETKDGTPHCDCPSGYDISENRTTCQIIKIPAPEVTVNADNFIIEIILMLSSVVTFLALLAMCLRRKIVWHVRAPASMRYLVHKVKQRCGECRQSGKPRYEKIRTVQEEYENDESLYSDLKQPLIENEDYICNI